MSVENDTPPATPLEAEPVAPSEPVNPQTPPVPKKEVDVDKLLAKVREEEKNKLYPEIEKQKKARQELEEQLIALRKQLDEKEFNSLSQEDKLKRQVEKFESAIDELAKSAEDREKQLLDRFNQVQVDAYKEKRLRELGGAVDDEFVSGSTVEEVEASIQKAVSLAEKIKAKLLPEVEAQVKAEHRVPMPQTPSVSQTVEDKIAPMSIDHQDWAKVREQFKRKALEGLK